jgi:hypothetical protein
MGELLQDATMGSFGLSRSEKSPKVDRHMSRKFTSRSLVVWALLAGALAGCSGIVSGQRRMERVAYQGRGGQQAPAPIERRPPAAHPNATQPNANQQGAGHLVGPGRAKGEHLAEWMNAHSNLTLGQQQQALEREPGFRELPAATQQRMRERLSQLNAMSPDKRQRVLDRNEAMERLTPDQRGQVRGAMQQLGQLPPEQRRAVAQSFRELRQLPANERMAAMLGSRYSWMNSEQKSALVHLIQVEPMIPVQ